MSQTLIGELGQAAALRREERIRAEEAERAALFLHEDAKTAAAQSARRRAELVEVLEQAAAAEEAAMARLGPTRLEHAQAERAVEQLGDQVAAGSDAAAKSIPKARDLVETCAEIVQAHERKTRTLAGERAAAEAALAEHDAAESARVAGQREAIMVTTASRIDALFADACPTLLLLGDMIQAYRAEHRPPEPWTPPWLRATPHAHAQRALLPALIRAEPGVERLGAHLSLGAETLAKVVGDSVALWRSGRGEVETVSPTPQGAA